MKKKNESDHLKRLALLSGSEQDLVLYDALHDKDLTKFFFLLKQGYTLTPFVLNVMIDYGYENKLLKAVEFSPAVKSDVYDFLCAYLGQEKAEDFLVEKDIHSLIVEKFSVESLVKYHLWDVLAEKGEYKALARAEKFDVLKEYYLKEKAGYKGGQFCISQALIDVGRSFNKPHRKIIDFLVDIEDFSCLAQIKGGLFKLLELKKWELIPVGDNMLENKTQDEVLQLIYDYGGEQYLYERARSFNLYAKFLLDHGYYRLFVDNKNWGILTNHKLDHLVDWDGIVAAKDWMFLALYHKRKLLFKYRQFGWWLKSFTY